MIRILIADDHRIVRQGIRQILEIADDIELVGETADGHAAVERLLEKDCRCDVAVFDMSMPGGGVDLIQRVRGLCPRLPILVLSMHDEAAVAAGALRAGASGYVTKDCDAETLLFAIRRLAGGGRYVDSAVVDESMLAGREEPLHARLSEREFAVLLRLARGETVTEVARQLSVSAKTVSTHKSNLMNKLEIDNNADLVRYAIRHGLVV